MFIILLIFSESLARDQTKFLFLNDETCMVRSTLINMKQIELNYCPFMISLKNVLEVAMSYLQHKQKT